MMRIKDWQRFQRYKRENVPWIKLHKRLLDDPEWHELSGDEAKVLVMLWLIASDTNDGTLPSVDKLAFRLRIKKTSLETIVSRLSHFLHNSFTTPSQQVVNDLSPEGEREGEGDNSEGDSRVVNKFTTPSQQVVKNLNGQTPTDEFLTKLKTNPAYSGIDIDRELAKMDAWLQTPKGKGRKKTRGFIVNWLNKVDVPVEGQPVSPPVSTMTIPHWKKCQNPGCEREKHEFYGNYCSSNCYRATRSRL